MQILRRHYASSQLKTEYLLFAGKQVRLSSASGALSDEKFTQSVWKRVSSAWTMAVFPLSDRPQAEQGVILLFDRLEVSRSRLSEARRVTEARKGRFTPSLRRSSPGHRLG